jgi:signal peptidase II
MEENKTPKEETPAKETPTLMPEKEPQKPAFQWTWKSAFFSFAWLGLLLFGIDLLSKWLIVWNLPFDGKEYAVIPGFFYIAPLTNEGSAYGAGGDISWMRYVYIVISWLATFAIPYFWYKGLNKHDNLINAVYMLCWAGAIGNAIDRTFYWRNIVGFSGVVDFLSIQIGNWVPFGSFNVADASLVVGVVMALVTILVREIKGKKE